MFRHSGKCGIPDETGVGPGCQLARERQRQPLPKEYERALLKNVPHQPPRQPTVYRTNGVPKETCRLAEALRRQDRGQDHEESDEADDCVGAVDQVPTLREHQISVLKLLNRLALIDPKKRAKYTPADREPQPEQLEMSTMP